LLYFSLPAEHSAVAVGSHYAASGQKRHDSFLFVMNTCLAACYDFIDEVFETQFYTVSWLPRLKAPVMIAEKRKLWFFCTVSLLPDKCQLPLNHRLFLYN